MRKFFFHKLRKPFPQLVGVGIPGVRIPSFQKIVNFVVIYFFGIINLQNAVLMDGLVAQTSVRTKREKKNLLLTFMKASFFIARHAGAPTTHPARTTRAAAEIEAEDTELVVAIVEPGRPLRMTGTSIR